LQASMNEFCVAVRLSFSPSFPPSLFFPLLRFLRRITKSLLHTPAHLPPSLPPFLPPSLPSPLKGEWRTKAYAPREYVPIAHYVPGPDGLTAAECDEYLHTHLDGFLGRLGGKEGGTDGGRESERGRTLLSSASSLAVPPPCVCGLAVHSLKRKIRVLFFSLWSVFRPTERSGIFFGLTLSLPSSLPSTHPQDNPTTTTTRSCRSNGCGRWQGMTRYGGRSTRTRKWWRRR